MAISVTVAYGCRCVAFGATSAAEVVAAQSATEGQRLPVAVRRKSPHLIAPWSPSPKRGHDGLDPGLVDEDQPPRVEAGLPGEPARPYAGDVRPGLLKGEQSFFEP